MKKILAILVGKIVHKLTRAFKIGGGSAAPGLYALKIYPNLVEDLATQVPKHVVITGTNGKTTTARMLAHFATKHGLKIIRNATGSNLERGIASALISHVHTGSVQVKAATLGIWELDEAAFNLVAPKLDPDIIVFLNISRDQLDRYGEVDTVLKNWCEAIKPLSHRTEILLNGDDENIVKLLGCFKRSVQKFGLSDQKIAGGNKDVPSQKFDLEAVNIKTKGLLGSSFQLTTNNKLITINLPLPGIYHIYDFLAAFGAGLKLGFQQKQMTASIKDYSPAFGRVEKFTMREDKKEGYIFLIKNPAGASYVFQTIACELKKDDRMLIALNDNLADGTDVSWIWDANFELIQNSSRARSSFDSAQDDPEHQSNGSRDYKIICSGSRAQDLAVRLKYVGMNQKYITVTNNLEQALQEAGKGLKGRLFILPTYTALLELQKFLHKLGIKDYYWKT